MAPLWTVLLLLGTLADAAHPARKTGPCSWTIDTSLRPSGVLATPNFPGRFPAPVHCKWLLNVSNAPDSYVVIWFTQLYVLSGLRVTEFVAPDVGAHVLLDSPQHPQNLTWVRSLMPFLLLELSLPQLEGHHVRTRHRLLDVFGFNVTYELVPRTTEPAAFPRRCSLLECSYTGDCLADATFENYSCLCYEGFSGDNCEMGPLCNAQVNPCLNGGVCRHMTADAVLCNCTDARFYGPLCEFSNVSECAQGGLCDAQCPYDGQQVCSCGLGPPVPPDRARYETTIGLVNVSRSVQPAAVAAAVNPGPARPLEALLESKLLKFLRGWNLTRVEDVRVIRIQPGSALTFSFISGKADKEELVLPALNALVRRGRLGPFELKSVSEFKKEPALYLESVRVNSERVVHEGDEFILSCLAQGSTSMEFRWFKDGLLVNDSLASREVEQSLLNRDSRDMYTALLRVVSAAKLDEGNFTCQVVDRGVQQCKSLFIEVAAPPSVTVTPMSVTLAKGDNLTIFCMSNNEKRSEKFGFNWTKNNALLAASATEVMEDLHPEGLLLRIYNAHQTGTYACHVQAGGGSSSARVEVAVTWGVPLCVAEQTWGVNWPQTAPGQEARQPCPAAATPRSPRAARRLCSLYETGVARWHQPDFSECVSPQLEKIHNKLRLLQLGYVATTAGATLQAVLKWLDSRKTLLPGEGEPVLALLQDALHVLQRRTATEVVPTSRAVCQAINVLLEHNASIVKPQKVTELQQLLRKQLLLWGAHLSTPSSAHLDLSALSLDVAKLASNGVYRLRFPLRPFEYPSWYSDKLDLRIHTSNSSFQISAGQNTDGNVTVAVIVYRSLSNFLPERYVARKADGDAVELELNSRVVSVTATRGADEARVEVELELARLTSGDSRWNATCAAARGATWNLDTPCHVSPGPENVTRCRCVGSGTFAALLTMHAPKPAARQAGRRDVTAALGCAACLTLCSAALLALSLQMWQRRSCLTLLKLQACVCVCGAMLVFLGATCQLVPQGWYPAATSALEAFLLVALAAPLSTLMLVYTEVVQIPGGVVPHLRHTVVSTITGLPVLAVFCSHLAHSSTSAGAHQALVLQAGSPRFTIFVVCCLGMAAMFTVVHSGATRRLHVLAAQNSGKNKAITRRIGLLWRATAVFSSLALLDVAALFYVNIPSLAYQCTFSLSAALLGAVMLLCLAINSETPLRLREMLKEKQKSEPELSSESLDSPLRLFMRPDVTRGNESANPGIVTDAEEALTASSPPEDEGRELLPIRTREHSPPAPQPPVLPSPMSQGTAETFVRDIERYDSSPKHYQPEGSPRSQFRQEAPIRPQPGRCYIEDSGVVVQACVEPCQEPWKPCQTEPWIPSTISGYVNMNKPCSDSLCRSRAIPVAPPCVPDFNYLKKPAEEQAACCSDATPRSVTFCDTVLEVHAPPANSSGEEPRRQPEGSASASDNAEGIIDRISHDLDFLLSGKPESCQTLPLRSSLSRNKKKDLKVKIQEPVNIIYITSPSHSCNCDSAE